MTQQEIYVSNSLTGEDPLVVAGVISVLPKIIKAVNESGWISVNDKMPDGYLPVISINSKGMIRIAEYAFYEKEWWKVPSLKAAKNTITHWMPLPKPPVREAEGG